MKNIFILLMLVFGCNPSVMLSAQETLAPCEAKVMSGHYLGVDKIIDQVIKQSPEISLTVFPSFSPEYGIRLASNKIYYVQLKSSFWAQANFLESGWERRAAAAVAKTKTQVFSAFLDPALVDRIKLVYKSSISRTKKIDSIGLDGTIYRFSMPSMGCGEIWSPEVSTPNGRLVALLNILISHSKLVIISDIQKSEQSIRELLDSIESGIN